MESAPTSSAARIGRSARSAPTARRSTVSIARSYPGLGPRERSSPGFEPGTRTLLPDLVDRLRLGGLGEMAGYAEAILESAQQAVVGKAPCTVGARLDVAGEYRCDDVLRIERRIAALVPRDDDRPVRAKRGRCFDLWNLVAQESVELIERA